MTKEATYEAACIAADDVAYRSDVQAAAMNSYNANYRAARDVAYASAIAAARVVFDATL